MRKNVRDKMKHRLVFVYSTLFVAGFAALLFRLVQLQVIQFPFLSARAAAQQLGEQAIPAVRGGIYDRNMTPLAKSAQAWDVAASPAYIGTDKLRRNIASHLSAYLGIDESTLYQELSGKSGYVVLAKKIEETSESQISKYLKDNNIGCVSLLADNKRYYPLGNFASQLIGFTGEDGQGLAGIEAEYNSVLAGIPGKTVYEKTATGGNMPYVSGNYVAAQNGDNLVLTIDQQVQQDLESNLSQALAQDKVSNRATGIVMNVQTGEILAMATVPGYDPNNPYTLTDATAVARFQAQGMTPKAAAQTALQTQWRNKAISEPYEPGSTFKIITAAAALQEGVVTQNTMFYDPGYVNIRGTVIHNWMGQGQGNLDFLKGFEYSNDTVFIQTGEMLGSSLFFQYYGNFGLTRKTGIDLPGEANSIYHGLDTLGPVQLASEAFGQSDKITPIQLITAVAAAANGGYLVQPHMVKEETDENGNIVKTFAATVKRQVISTKISQEIDTMLNAEVSIGTGKNAYVAGYRIGGKTGTSQKLDSSDPSAVVSSMVGVAPTDDPKVAVLVVLDEPHAPNIYGGVIAAPVIGNIMSEILPYLGVVPKYTSQELATLDVRAPSVTGKSAADAEALLKGQGLNAKIVGSGGTVTDQVPASGDPVPQSGTVTLYLDTMVQQTVTVPSVLDLTPTAAQRELKDMGLNAELQGTGLTDADVTAYEQLPASGSKVAPGTVVTVKFRNNKMNVR